MSASLVAYLQRLKETSYDDDRRTILLFASVQLVGISVGNGFQLDILAFDLHWQSQGAEDCESCSFLIILAVSSQSLRNGSARWYNHTGFDRVSSEVIRLVEQSAEMI